MSFDFPANPTAGQEYSPFTNGPIYVWNAPRWLVKGTPIVSLPGTKEGFDEALTDGDFVYEGDVIPASSLTGTKAQFNTAVTDGNFLYVGDKVPSGDITGLGTMAVQNADSVAISGGTMNLTGAATSLSPAGEPASFYLNGTGYTGAQTFRLMQGVTGVSNGGVSLRNETTGITNLSISPDGAVNVNSTVGAHGDGVVNVAGSSTSRFNLTTPKAKSQVQHVLVDNGASAPYYVVSGGTDGSPSISTAFSYFQSHQWGNGNGVVNMTLDSTGALNVNGGINTTSGNITAGGKVGIGGAVDTGAYKLVVRAVGVAAPGNGDALRLRNESDGGVNLTFSNSVANLAGITAAVNGTGAGTDDCTLKFWTSNNNSLAVNATLNNLGDFNINGSYSLPAGKYFLGINSPETFPFLGKNIAQYGMSWDSLSDTSGNVVANISGWAGIRFYSASNEQARLDSLALTVNGNVSAGGRLETNVKHNGGGVVLSYNNANAASRAWWIANDYNAYGDLMIATNATQTGTINVPRIYINASGNFFSYGETLRTSAPGIGNIGLRASGPNNAGYIEFYKADANGGARVGYIGNIAYDGGDVQYANETGGGHSFNSTIYCPRVAVSGNRPITLDTAGGSINMKGDTGGWNVQMAAFGSAGTYRGGFGIVGGGDALTYHWMGIDYNSGNNFKVYPDGICYARQMVVAVNHTVQNAGSGGLRFQTAGAANTGYIEFLKPDGGRSAYIGFQEISGNQLLRYNNEGGGTHEFIGGPIVTGGGLIMRDTGSNLVKDVNNGSLNISGGTSLGNGGGIVLRGSTQTYNPYCAEIYSFNRERIRVAEHPVLIGWDTAHINSIVGSGFLRVASDFTESNYCICASAPGQTGMYAFQCVVSGSHVGGISCSSSATQYNTSSDVRLKENIVDTTVPSGPLIDQIRIREFDFKVDGKHVEHGTIAQELVEVYPDAVTMPWMDDPNSFAGVDYTKLVPLLIKEIQDLRIRLAALEGAA